jgi:N-acetylneuraminate synthase
MSITEFMLAPVDLGAGFPMPLVIAEVGVNHEGRMDLARRLIEEAKEGGADAVKFQTYKAGKIASKDSPYYWDISKEPTLSQYELFQRYDRFGEREFGELRAYCDAVGIEFLSSPFDLDSAAYLNRMMNVFKISSSDITNKPFIQALAAYGKPILLSTGGATLAEIAEAVAWIEEAGVPLALLHCVLNYPTLDENATLGSIPVLARHFPRHVIGYSDHTEPKDMRTLEVATLLGARILEKHFTFDKTLPGNDHYHAMDKEDLQRFRANMERVRALVGPVAVQALASEEPARKNARRSLVAARDIPAGAVIAREDLTWKRPAHGISPRCIDEVLGMQARASIPEDTVLQWRLLE